MTIELVEKNNQPFDDNRDADHVVLDETWIVLRLCPNANFYSLEVSGSICNPLTVIGI